MDRTAVFIDAGYLFAAGSKLIANERLPRGDLNLDYDAMLAMLGELVAEVTGLPLLRVYWYDGTSADPSRQQVALAFKPNVKLRLGFVNQHGQQKGVDSLIVSDLITLARNRAMADVLLMTGDEDIRVGVQHAQEFGVRVHLLGVAPSRENQSGFLVQEADGVRELTLSEVQSFLTCVAHDPGIHLPSGQTGPRPCAASLDAAVQQVLRALNEEEMHLCIEDARGGSVPPEVDRRLLAIGCQVLGCKALLSKQKRQIREAFLAACKSKQPGT